MLVLVVSWSCDYRRKKMYDICRKFYLCDHISLDRVAQWRSGYWCRLTVRRLQTPGPGFNPWLGDYTDQLPVSNQHARIWEMQSAKPAVATGKHRKRSVQRDPRELFSLNLCGDFTPQSHWLNQIWFSVYCNDQTHI